MTSSTRDAFADLWQQSNSADCSKNAADSTIGLLSKTGGIPSQIPLSHYSQQKVPSTSPWDALDVLAAGSLVSDNVDDDWDLGSIQSSAPVQSLALLDDDIQDDILGELARPIFQRPPSPPHSQTHTPPPLPKLKPSPSLSCRVTPPPHVLGQLVEMGFSVRQAKLALASTDTGVDVQAALDFLLHNRAASSPPTSVLSSSLPPSRSVSHTASRDLDTPSSSDQNNLQDQADKFITQANQIGLNVFNKASAFLKEKKVQVQKAYIERNVVSTARSGGRPKWLQDGIQVDSAIQTVNNDNKWKMVDSPATPFIDTPSPESHSFPPEMNFPKHGIPIALKSSVDTQKSMFPEDNGRPSIYVSPYRRGKAKNPQEYPHCATQGRTPIQSLVSASVDSVVLSYEHKCTGTIAFKLGQYATAESSYSAAISSLPTGHLLLVPLLNNRSIARIKTGDYNGATEDCTAALRIVADAGFDPQQQHRGRVMITPPGCTRKEDAVDIAQGWLKALHRRAEAFEGREKWIDAGRDWGVLIRTPWVRPISIREEAVRGAARCRRVGASAGAGAFQSTSSLHLPRQHQGHHPSLSKPSFSVPCQPSKAIKNFRKANIAAEAEEQQRHELKDAVDARLASWRGSPGGGKESNIRALLGSLDAVLWPELGMPSVGMADLVSPKQVKMAYMRVIAKLHPDKLNSTNTSVERRMIANAVFGTLNEAWNAFKP